MAILAAVIAGLIAGWAFARGRPARLGRGALAAMLGAGATALVAALAGDEPLVGAALGIAVGARLARDPRPTIDHRLPLLLVALLLLRLGFVIAGALPLAPDEAQYWDWSRSPDLAYYSKPGGLAWLIGLWRAVAGDGLLGLRLLGLGLATATMALVWPAALAASRRRDIAWLATILAALLPIHACTAGMLVTDVPLLLCWTGFLAVLLRTPAAGGSPAWWHVPALGGLLAAGLTAKYAMLYAPLALLAALPVLPTLRAWLRTPAPWLILILGACGLVPTLLWNAEHAWVGLAHLAGQCGIDRGYAPDPASLVEFIAGQAAFALPASLLLPWAVTWAWRQRTARPAAWLLAVAALTPLAVLLPVSLHTTVQANWAAMSWIPAAILCAWWLVEAAGPRARRVAVVGAVLALLAAVLAVAVPDLRARLPELPPSAPERKLTGWDELAATVARVQAQQSERTVTLTMGYDVAAELAWHNRTLPRPLCANFGRRMNQYDLWDGMDASRLGWDAVFVAELDSDDPLDGDLADRLPSGLRADFAGSAAPQLVRVRRGNRIWRNFLVVRLRGFDGTLDSTRPISAW